MDRRDFLRLLLSAGVSFSLYILGCKREKTKKAIKTDKTHPQKTEKTAPATEKTENNIPDTKLEDDEIFKILRVFIEKHAADPEIPWAVAHGVLALGFDLKMPNGERGIDFLFNQLKKTVIAGEEYYYFPTGEYYHKLCDSHPNTILKILLNYGINEDEKFNTPFGTIQFKKLLHDATMLTHPQVLNSRGEPEFDWSLEVLTKLKKPDDAVWQNAYGEKIDLNALTLQNLATLEKHTSYIAQLYLKHFGTIPQPSIIQHDLCAGAHLLWGNLWAIGRGFGGEAAKKRIKFQIDILFFRLQHELELYERIHQSFIKKSKTKKERQARIWLWRRDQFKFLSHHIESVAIVRDLDLFELKDKHLEIAENAKNELRKLIYKMNETGMFKYISRWRLKHTTKDDIRGVVYYDIVGDACHSFRSLKLF